MILTGRSGYPGTCAAAAPAKRSAAPSASARAIIFASAMAFSLASRHPASRAVGTPDTVTNALAECKRRRCDGRSAQDRAANRGLVDHLISAYQKRLADAEPDSLGSFEVDQSVVMHTRLLIALLTG